MQHTQRAAMLTPMELAERWKVPIRLLATWRYEGRGPRYIKIEGSVRYRLDDVLAYEDKEPGREAS